MIHQGKQHFDDMRIRVINSAPCKVEYSSERPGCWPYGVLLFSTHEDGILATFGDLTVNVNLPQAFELLKIAGVLKEGEWQCPLCSV